MQCGVLPSSYPIIITPPERLKKVSLLAGVEEGVPAAGAGLLAIVDGLAARGNVAELGSLELDQGQHGHHGLGGNGGEHLELRLGGLGNRSVHELFRASDIL